MPESLRKLFVAMVLSFFGSHQANCAVVTSPATNSYIVSLQRETDQDRCARDFAVTRRFSYHHALNGFAAALDDATVQKLKHDPRVWAVELDDAKFVPCAQTVPSGIIRMGLTNFPMTHLNGLDNRRINVNVAVLDTGIQTNHPDLNVVQWVDCTGSGLDGEDLYGHGTHVAGIIGALDNDIGVVGVAPGANLWSVQIMDSHDSITLAYILAGLDYIAQHADQIEIVNASFGGNADDNYEIFHEAVSNVVSMGIVFVAASGNGSLDVLGNGVQGSDSNTLPAAFPEVMAVSAMSPNTSTNYDINNRASIYDIDTYWTSANDSHTPKSPSLVNSPGLAIDVTAPGVNILSTYLNSDYTTMTGTSMATGYVSGLIALYIAANGRAHSLQDVVNIRQAIVDNSQPQADWLPYGLPVVYTTNDYNGVESISLNTGDVDGHYEPLAYPSENWIPQPAFTGLTNTSEGFQLSFTAVPGYSYTVQSTASLGVSNQWNSLSTFSGAGSVAPVTFTDTNLNTAYFYRLMRQPAP